MEIKTNTQNIWHWVKCFSWASGLCFALLFHLGEISTLGESAFQSLLHKCYSETSVMYSCLFKKMGHFHTNVIFLCRKYAEFIPYLLVKAIPLLVLWFQHICLTGDNQKKSRKNDYFLINSCRPNVRLSTWVAVSLGHAQEYHPPMADLSFEQEASDFEQSESQSRELLLCWESGDLGKEVFLMSLFKKMPGCLCAQGSSHSHKEPTGWSQQRSDELCKSPRALQQSLPHRMNFHLKWTWAPGTAALKKQQTHPASGKWIWPCHFIFGKGTVDFRIGVTNQVDARDGQPKTCPDPKPVGACCQSLELHCSQHCSAAIPVLLRWLEMFGTCCWSFLNSH